MSNAHTHPGALRRILNLVNPVRSTQGQRGFTLIELMITVAIVGILAAVAYPAYTDSVLKGRRAEGRMAILSLLQQQERYFTQYGTYMSFSAGATGNNGTTVAGGGNAIPFKTTSGDNGAYNLRASACTGMALNECVSISAVPVHTDEAAGTLVADTAGGKSCTGTKTNFCW